MPPASGKKSDGPSRRVERCQYTERGQRCRRSGTGDPPLCHPHRLVMADAGRPPAGPGAGIKNLVDRFVNGKRVSRKVWDGAIDDIARWVTSQEDPVPGPNGPRFRPPSGFRPPPGWFPFGNGQAAPPPPPDPIIEERRRSRIVLGFSPSEVITLELIQQRRRKLARQHHPDRGGSVAKMQTVNVAADVLEAMVREKS